jgi:uncharacterized MAPEG superfamily protein
MQTTLICFLIIMTMPIVLALSTIPFRFAQFGKPDIQQPRLQANQLMGTGYRLDAAQKNAWEALILFGAALVFASLAGVDFKYLSTPALLFVSARVLHAVFYTFNLAVLRFLAFMTSIMSIGWIVVVTLKSM